MPINSKNKGKNGELEFCRLCHAEGYNDVHRTAQYRGNTGQAGDVEGLPGIHVEVKRNERLNILWSNQSEIAKRAEKVKRLLLHTEKITVLGLSL